MSKRPALDQRGPFQTQNVDKLLQPGATSLCQLHQSSAEQSLTSELPARCVYVCAGVEVRGSSCILKVHFKDKAGDKTISMNKKEA